MSLTMEQIAEAFCSHRFTEAYPHMAEEIKWNIIGKEELIGREAVINQCDNAAKYLATVSSTIAKLKSYRVENVVFLEGVAQFIDQENQTSGVASCDVFHFTDGRIVEITSYVIDVSIP